ncbi:hypothetical protein TSOC_008523 [Tetrabaena socialis]|uniref:phytol kinase n=1 Tax=Tetrabaena socialis TaxID=47790 RepID=A0A2J7ZY91_9CHLO|nr:hypothetical protein TSOC_008523 [Tetrabaena socialis]|eukprot:PNH05233.1 hypothetical protein TSOC_008523 [Tetrabaena socialis]
MVPGAPRDQPEWRVTATLDRGIVIALRRLPALANRLSPAEGPDASSSRSAGGHLPTAAVTKELHELLMRVRDYLEQLDPSPEGSAAASAVLEDGAARVAWLKVVSVAVRQPLTGPSSGDSTPEATALLAQEACTTTSLLLHLLSMQQPPSAAAPDFIRKLLRIQMLQCLARRLAEAAVDTGSLTAQQLELTVWYAKFLFCIVHALGTSSTASGPDQRPWPSLGRQLAEALLDSSVVEHGARLALVLQQRAPTCGVDSVQLVAKTMLYICGDISALHGVLKEGGNEATCAALRQVLSGRCAQHAVLVHGVAALCWADGGPTYGLPDAVRQAALGSCMVPSAGQADGGRPVQLPTADVQAFHSVLGKGVPLTPVGTQVAVQLLLRLGRLVVASGGEWAAQQAGLRSVPGPAHAAGPGMVVPREDVHQCAAEILPKIVDLLGPLLAAGAPDWVAEAGADCWRLLVAVMSRPVLRVAITQDLEWLWAQTLLLWVPPLLPGEPLPSDTPPVIAAMLAGGVLPCLERLLRRAGEEPLGPESALVRTVLRCDKAWDLWSRLLAYGEPRQAAALVVTVGKLLRRVGVTGMSFVDEGALFALASSVLTRAMEVAVAPEVSRPRQLASLLMRAVCEWLPELSRVALTAASGGADELARVLQALTPLLVWLPPLLLRCGCGGGSGATAGTATAGGADAVAGSSAVRDSTANDLRLLLLAEVRAVPLLGSGLRLARHVQGGAGRVIHAGLARSCCLVAAMWPDELMHSLVRYLREEGAGQIAGAGQVADGVLALAELLEAWAAGGSSNGSDTGGCDDQEARAWERFIAATAWLRMAVVLVDGLTVTPAEARRTCSYRGCIRLAGDSEAEARLQACGRCGAAWYCCRACQLSHWREGGHKEACAGGAKAQCG